MENVTLSVDHILGNFIDSLKGTHSFKCPNSGKKVEFKRYFSKPPSVGISGVPPETVPDINELVGCCHECVNMAQKHFKKLLLKNIEMVGARNARFADELR